MSAAMPDWQAGPDDLDFHGAGLSRPECVLCTAAGDVITSYWSDTEGGVTHIAADGSQRNIAGSRGAEAPPVGTNGFALARDGSFLLADLHSAGGGVWRLSPAGRLEPLLQEIDGTAIPPTNFVGVDTAGRIWATVSTWQQPRQKAYRRDIADGFIILIDHAGARIVADGIGYTNEAIVHPGGDWLYVNETFGRRTTRYQIRADNSLGPREVVAEYGPGTFPDGLAFDEEGAVWITSVLSNRLIRVSPDGTQRVVFEDSDQAAMAVVEAAYQGNMLGREHMDAVSSKVAKSISSLAFGGPDRKTIYLGNLLDDRLYTLQSPVAGARPSHWEVRL